MPFGPESDAGIWVPLVTPFRDDAPDLARLEMIVQWLLARGVHGVLALGSTGEAPHLDDDEAAAVLRCIVGAVRGRVPVMAGCSRPSTHGTIRALEASARAGADAGLVLAPFYYRTQMRDEAILAYYRDVATASPLPLFVYHIPQVTGIEMQADLLARLVALPNVRGFKDSTVSGGPLRAALQAVSTHGFVGHGGRLLEALQAGACGGILAVAHVLPEAAVTAFAAHRRGAREVATAAQAQLQTLVGAWRGHGVAGVKFGLEVRGLDCGVPRAPLPRLPVDVQRAVAAAIDAALRSAVDETRPAAD